uniref:Putative ovule protein n=1 Tax=Solanum chacoense TaxID=4108 RepID=A0A0V0IE60_SOLCH
MHNYIYMNCSKSLTNSFPFTFNTCDTNSSPSWASSFFPSHFKRAIKAQDSFVESASFCSSCWKIKLQVPESRKWAVHILYTAVYTHYIANYGSNVKIQG